jgi:hypothetical protein
MDAGLLGALIGVGVMACLGLAAVLNEKGRKIVEKCQRVVKNYKQQKQPLLLVTSQNPVLVRVSSKQFKMKELLLPK